MADSQLPSQIGPYHIERQLGAGGMGTVYLGTHLDSGRETAVKVLDASMSRDAAIAERFQREIDAMRSLGGAHIVSLYDSGSDAVTGQLYFAMEYVDGPTLADYIRLQPSRRIPWDQVIDLSLQICSALKVAHAAGVVHRDLKPSNLLIGKNGTLKLTDFGVAQVFAADRLTVTGGIIGTVEFMSPEQAEGKRATKKSDLYSLGAVMYAMLTGRPPFIGKTMVDIIRKHATARFDLPSLYEPNVPRVLEEVVCKLLSKNPDDRLPDAYIVSLRLKEVSKRMELAMSQNSSRVPVASVDDDDGDGDATLNRPEGELLPGTLLAPAHIENVGETRAAPGRSPSSATLMRDLFKAHVDQESRTSPLGSFFNHTGVLLTILVLSLGSIAWWWGQAVSDSRLGDEPEVTASAKNLDEVDRFLRIARSHRRSGDFAREESVLTALRVLISADPARKKIVEQIDARLDDLAMSREIDSEGNALVHRALERAKTLLKDGQDQAAMEILTSITTLYGDDSRARSVVAEAQSLVEQSRKTFAPR